MARKLQVPFKTGILIGIGETRNERIDTCADHPMILPSRKSHVARSRRGIAGRRRWACSGIHPDYTGATSRLDRLADPTFREAVLMHSVGRLALHPLIPNIQTSWAKMGPAGAAVCLKSGAKDLGGTVMNESISREGTQHGQEFPPHEMETLIRSIGREPMHAILSIGRCRKTVGRHTSPRKKAAVG